MPRPGQVHGGLVARIPRRGMPLPPVGPCLRRVRGAPIVGPRDRPGRLVPVSVSKGSPWRQEENEFLPPQATRPARPSSAASVRWRCRRRHRARRPRGLACADTRAGRRGRQGGFPQHSDRIRQQADGDGQHGRDLKLCGGEAVTHPSGAHRSLGRERGSSGLGKKCSAGRCQPDTSVQSFNQGAAELGLQCAICFDSDGCAT